MTTPTPPGTMSATAERTIAYPKANGFSHSPRFRRCRHAGGTAYVVIADVGADCREVYAHSSDRSRAALWHATFTHAPLSVPAVTAATA